MRAWLLAAVLLAAVPAGCGGDAATPQRVRLVTTTSTANSGLLAHLLRPFQEKTGIEVVVVAVGTGQALALGRQGNADLVLVHAREREDAFVASGHGVDRRDVMWNEFVIVGPPEDPAEIGGQLPTEALLRILESQARFVSRGDDSGTHIRERALWKAAGLDPEIEPYYWKAGQGMGKCIVMADEKRAYTLADRGTYLAFRARVDLVVLVEGDESLRNPYGAIRVNPDKHPGVNAKGALRLLDYMVSTEGQQRIDTFRVDGTRLFHPAAER